jgi:hypothetical protein
MERTWTPEEAQGWVERRDKSRSRLGLPSLDDLRRDDPKSYKMALEKEKSCLLDRLGKLTKETWSWNVGGSTALAIESSSEKAFRSKAILRPSGLLRSLGRFSCQTTIWQRMDLAR